MHFSLHTNVQMLYLKIFKMIVFMYHKSTLWQQHLYLCGLFRLVFVAVMLNKSKSNITATEMLVNATSVQAELL